MTVIEAINKVDAMKPNIHTMPDKIGWLSVLDGNIKNHIIDTHEGAESVSFDGYTDDSLEKTLLVPPPYDVMYIRWLEAQIDYANGEYAKYNNSIITYNADYEAFANYYNRTHMPLNKGRFQF